MNLQERVKNMQMASQAVVNGARFSSQEEYEAMRVDAMKKEMEKHRLEKIENVLKAIPPRFCDKTFDDFKTINPNQKFVKNIANRYVATFKDRLAAGTGMLFLGSPGTGKTLLSLIIYQALAKAGFDTRYESSLHFLRLLRDKNFESHAAFTSLLNEYKRIQFLVIDEATESRVTGKQLTEWEKEMLFAVIDMRYQQGNLCTLIISNRSQTEVVDRLGERIVRRVIQNGMTLAFDWDSYQEK